MDKKTREILELVAYIFLGYLIAVGANKGFAMALHTDYPVVAVITRSMIHENPEQTFVSWFNERNYTQAQLESFPFPNGIRQGDLVVVRGIPFDKIRVGDVIVYKFPGKEPIIHRVVEIKNQTIYTKGDNNMYMDQLGDAIAPPITAKELKGKAVFHIPLLGYVKIIVLKLIR